MNSKRFDGKDYPVHLVTDLKDMLEQSIEAHASDPAYLVKDKELGKFVPIPYGRVGRDYRAFGTKLVDMGLKGKKVGVIGETRYEWLITYYAVTCGVGIIVPLDKNLPEGELLGLIERSGMDAIVYSERCAERIDKIREEGDQTIRYFISMDLTPDEEEARYGENGTERDVPEEKRILSQARLIEEGAALVGQGDRSYIDAEIDPDQVATLLFTSGTTGLAKGVLLSHRNFVNNVMQLSQFFKIPEPGIVFSILPIHHVYEMTCDMLTTFYQGKTIAICEGLKYIQKNMQEVHPQVMLGVPLVFEKLYQGMWKQAKRRGEDEKLRRAIDLSKQLRLYNTPAVVRRMFQTIYSSFGGAIDTFIVGGAAADPHVIEEFEAMGIRMIQGYGMSECAPIVALNRDRYRKAASVGQAMTGTDIRIIDQDEEGIGEVIVRSPSVMLGYYENPEATAEAIQDGWLHTGDLGYFDQDGFLYLTGRSKTVIVTKGGKNIFPEEVEDVLMKNELIQEVLVHGVEDKRVGNVIVTADIYPNYELLRSEQGEMTKSEVYHFYRDLVDEINESMPPYKQVKRVNIRETEFVKTTTGKIKRYGNRLSGAELAQAETGAGGIDFNDLRRIEEKHAKKFARDLAASENPAIAVRDVRPVSTVKELVTSSAGLYKNRVAFRERFGNADTFLEITYGQAASDIEGLGTALCNRGLDRKNVALFGTNTYPFQISLLTVLCGGGTAVPIDCQLDEDEIVRQVNVSDATVAMFSDRYLDLFRRLRDSGATKLDTYICFAENDITAGSDVLNAEDMIDWRALIEEGKEQVSHGDRQFLDAEVSGQTRAMILFTSGSTGPAKGVCLTHTNLSADLMAAAALMEIRESDAVYSVMPSNNIVQTSLGLLLPLYRGAAVVNFLSVDAMEDDFRICSPTVLVSEPVLLGALYDRIMEYLEANGRLGIVRLLGNANRLAHRVGVRVLNRTESAVQQILGGRLRLIVTGGGRIEPANLDAFESLGIATVQGYGMSECAPLVSLDSTSKAVRTDHSAVGFVLPGVKVKVAGRRGGSGEILVKGRNVMTGYYKDPERTQEALQDGWFHTGDLGWVDGENRIHLLGRKKQEEDQ